MQAKGLWSFESFALPWLHISFAPRFHGSVLFDTLYAPSAWEMLFLKVFCLNSHLQLKWLANWVDCISLLWHGFVQASSKRLEKPILLAYKRTDFTIWIRTPSLLVLRCVRSNKLGLQIQVPWKGFFQPRRCGNTFAPFDYCAVDWGREAGWRGD